MQVGDLVMAVELWASMPIGAVGLVVEKQPDKLRGASFKVQWYAGTKDDPAYNCLHGLGMIVTHEWGDGLKIIS